MNIKHFSKSSNIESISYKKGTLVVAFKHGGLYIYTNVPSWIYALFFRAKSIGKMFAKFVRPFPALYPYVKVSE